ncbi:hypothetical protein LTR36_004173 [Oleoguttula mirabilis]|uniref:NmrA-like domain-containing protein n=1 Tax=Oleoguttula mirabilis TaxID=1507867 RepID=A0AAV9JI89_9PEZI|nr:hypothetical protein LTR36_004173 [Oleoguttula mirabilis]
MSVNFESDLLLITAASGKQSSHLIPQLVKQWKRIRLQVASTTSADNLAKQYANNAGIEVVQADMSDAQACTRIMDGVAACFLVTPGFHPHETECGYNIIDAALSQPAGQFKHLVHSSVIYPVLRKLLNHDSKRYVEEYLIESGLPYTIVQPTTLMENLPIAKLIQEASPTHACLWNPETEFSFVSCRDVGAACANILAEREKHYYATYQLVGTPQPLSYNDAVGIVSTALGKAVKLEQKSIEEGVVMFSNVFTRGELTVAAPFATTQGAARMFMYYNGKGLLGNPNVLEMVLGRKPLDYRAWVDINVRECKGGGHGARESGSGSGKADGLIARSTGLGLR